MLSIDAVCVDTALQKGLWLLYSQGLDKGSRNGPVRVAPCPVATVYHAPMRRVLHAPARRPNPFLHLFEAFWVLAGRKDVAFLSYFADNFKNYSDNGTDFHAPYGHRLREHFGFDQIDTACEMLSKDPSTRRVVMSIWDPVADLGRSGKDIPCNDMVMLSVDEDTDALDMTVCNRSNDIIWGAYGSNVVQFSVLLEYMSSLLGMAPGTYTQVSNNYHAYTDLPFWQKWNASADKFISPMSPYESLENWVETSIFGAQPAVVLRDIRHMLTCFDEWREDPMGHNRSWAEDLKRSDSCKSIFFREVAIPMLCAHGLYKIGLAGEAVEVLKKARKCDWTMSGLEWLRGTAAFKEGK